MVLGDHVAAIVAVVIVGTHADGCREAVEEFVGEVELSTVNVLLAFHLRVEGVLIRRNAVGCKHTLHEHVEHGHALAILNKTATAHDADHPGEGDAVFLVGGKEGWHDGSRSDTLVGLTT